MFCLGLLFCVDILRWISADLQGPGGNLAPDGKTCLRPGDWPSRSSGLVCEHTRPGEGTSVHSLSPNLGLISSKDVQIKAVPGTFYQASPPSIWSQTNREPTRLHVSKRSTRRHKLGLKDSHTRSQLFPFCVMWSWFILSLILRF